MDLTGPNATLCEFPDTVDDTWVNTFGYYANGPILSIVITIGLFGNILCLFTLTRPKHRLPQINQYLIALGIWDTALITLAFFVYNLPYLVYGGLVTHGPYVLMYPLGYTLSCASYMGSIWMVMISAIDRYFALCHPLTHRVYVGGPSRTRYTLTICSLTCLLFNVPKYLEMSLDQCWDPETNTWIPSVTSSGLRDDQRYWIGYKIIGGLLFYSAVPFSALTYLSARVSYEVRRLTHTPEIDVTTGRQTQLSPSQTSQTPPEKRVSVSEVVVENKRVNSLSILRRHSVTPQRLKEDPKQALNFMLVAMLLKFLVCHSLPTVLDIWESSLDRHTPFLGPVIDVLVDTSNFLVVLNSSVNVFIYACCSRRFRQDAKKLLLQVTFPIKHKRGFTSGTYTSVRETSAVGRSGRTYLPVQASVFQGSSSVSGVAV